MPLPTPPIAWHDASSPAPELCRALLERIGASIPLRRAPRLREFLEYVGRRALEDRCEQIHEQEIGVNVFGRTPGYDTSADNIVRANATELRKRIEAYFESEGVDETLRLEIPRGSYVPVFSFLPLVKTPAETPLVASPPLLAAVQGTFRRQMAWERWVVAGMLLLLVGLTVHLWQQNRQLEQDLRPWKSQPHLAALWSHFAQSSRVTDIVISDQAFLLVQNMAKQTFTFDEYLNRSFLIKIQGESLTPDMREAINVVAIKNMSSLAEVRIGHQLMALDPVGSNFHLYSAREFSPPLFARDNVILIGGPVSNPWQQTISGRLNFVHLTAPNFQSPIQNRAPAPGELPVYRADTDPLGYCVVAYLPNPNNTGKMLLIDGTSSEATEAGGNFLLSEDHLSAFLNKAHPGSLPYFEVLLKTVQASDTPITTTVVAYRIYGEAN
jgi:hypothetical protein